MTANYLVYLFMIFPALIFFIVMILIFKWDNDISHQIISKGENDLDELDSIGQKINDFKK